MASWRVRCLGSVPRRTPFSSRNRSSRRRAISLTSMALRPRRRQLNGERDPVEPPADLDDRRCGGGVQLEAGVGGLRPLDEQGHGRHRRQIEARGVRAAVDRQRLDRPHVLARDGERLPARRQDRHRRRRSQDAVHQPGDRLDEVLAVVEHQQRVAGAEHVDDRLLDRRPLPGVHVESRRERLERRSFVDDRHQLDEVDAVGVVAGDHAAPARSRPTSCRRPRSPPASRGAWWPSPRRAPRAWPLARSDAGRRRAGSSGSRWRRGPGHRRRLRPHGPRRRTRSPCRAPCGSPVAGSRRRRPPGAPS